MVADAESRLAKPSGSDVPKGGLDAAPATWTMGAEEDGRQCTTGSAGMSRAGAWLLCGTMRARAGRAPQSAEPGKGRASGAAQRCRS